MLIEQERQTLFLDFDNTIVNSTMKISELYNEDFLYYKDFKVAKWYKSNSWGFEDICPLVSKEVLNGYFTQPRFFTNLQFMDNAFEVLGKLHNKYKIVVVSMGNYANLCLKEIWIKKYLNGIVDEFIGIDFDNASDKSGIDMGANGIMIDDNTKYLESCKADVKICFGDKADYNSGWQGERCFNWYEVMNRLM